MLATSPCLNYLRHHYEWIGWRCGVIFIAHLNTIKNDVVDRSAGNCAHRKCKRRLNNVFDCGTILDNFIVGLKKTLSALNDYRFEKPRNLRNKQPYTAEHIV